MDAIGGGSGLGPAGTKKEEWSHGLGAGARARREGSYGARGDGE